MSQYHYIALWVSGAAAVLSVFMIPMWILGIPGNPPPGGSWEKPWTIGLYTVIGYPIAWLCLLIFWLIARKLISPEHLPVLHQWIGAGALTLLVAAVFLISYGFRNTY